MSVLVVFCISLADEQSCPASVFERISLLRPPVAERRSIVMSISVCLSDSDRDQVQCSGGTAICYVQAGPKSEATNSWPQFYQT